MLKAQLNPHFLFNTLHSISSLVKADPDKAQNMLVSLGDLLREIIFINHEDKITLTRELEILKKYIDIMLIRFSDHLSIDIAISDEVKMALVPSLLTQPIVENSIKHGYSSEHTHLNIKIEVYKLNKKLIIRIENNGQSLELDDKIKLGTGIRNIKARLETLYGSECNFTFSSLDQNKGVVTIIKIPFEI
jgi:LytS/YehU family sensor histidine kinase